MLPALRLRCVLALPLLLAPLIAPAQSPASSSDSATVVAVVQRYIDALMARDTGWIRTASLVGATQVALAVDGGATAAPVARSVDEVIAGLARETRRFVGRVWAPRVSIEGPVAVFTAPYDAWYDGRFSHCGTDHYILAKSGARWLVSQLIFTRQREGCAPSPLGPPKQ